MTNGNDPVIYAPEWTTNGEPLNKREYFAAMAMQGILAHHGVVSVIEDAACTVNEYACDAVAASDALIAALNEGKL